MFAGRPRKMRASDLGLDEPARDYAKEILARSDSYHSIGWKGLIENGEEDHAGLDPVPVHCEIPHVEDRALQTAEAFYYGQRSRGKLRHADRWYTYDSLAPYVFVGFDNRRGPGRRKVL